MDEEEEEEGEEGDKGEEGEEGEMKAGRKERETRERRERQQPLSRPLSAGSEASSGLRAPSCGCWLHCCSLLAFPPILIFPQFGCPQCSLLTPSASLLLPTYPGRRKGVLGCSWGHCVHPLPGAKHDRSSLLSGRPGHGRTKRDLSSPQGHPDPEAG